MTAVAKDSILVKLDGGQMYLENESLTSVTANTVAEFEILILKLLEKKKKIIRKEKKFFLEMCYINYK